MEIEYSPIENGQYTVQINLNEFQVVLDKIWNDLNKPENQDHNAYLLNQGILKYKSETLLPEQTGAAKTKLLFVFGNPAIHSITNGMFFFSRTDSGRHSLWGKLAKAGVFKQVTSNKHNATEARREEAEIRKRIILDGQNNSQYSIGMTTFYSFPTTAEGGVKKAEDLFAPVLKELQKHETNRILSYAFTQGAKIIFVQKSSHRAFLANAPQKDQETIFWPIRGKGASGSNLKTKLQEVDH